jgi:hypothetical protein
LPVLKLTDCFLSWFVVLLMPSITFFISFSVFFCLKICQFLKSTLVSLVSLIKYWIVFLFS